MRQQILLKTRFFRTSLEVAVALVVVVGSTAASHAITPRVAGQVNHFLECFGLMVTDPVAHSQNCGPGVPASYESPSNNGASSPEVTTTADATTTITSDPTTTTTSDPTTTTTSDPTTTTTADQTTTTTGDPTTTTTSDQTTTTTSDPTTTTTSTPS